MTFANCSEAYAAGVSDIKQGDPSYAKKLDRDNDGVGCETADAPAGFIAGTQTGTKVETGKGDGSALPKTGPESVFALAGVLLLIGVALAIVVRRRRIRFTA